MTRRLANLSPAALSALAHALETRRLTAPYSPAAVGRSCPVETVDAVAVQLESWASEGLTGRAIAAILRALEAERRAADRLRDQVELVWSGPMPVAGVRATDVVVRHLFEHAQHHVTVVSYALDQGPKSRRVFAPLAENMARRPELAVTLCINIKATKETAGTAVADFATRFVEEQWPQGAPLPRVFFDPRSLTFGTERASLHAKFIAVDDREALITSANFTEAAHARNFETGVRLVEPASAAALRRHVLSLIDSGSLVAVPLPKAAAPPHPIP